MIENIEALFSNFNEWDIKTCPICKAERGGSQGIHSNKVSVWCLRCGWAINIKEK